MQRLNSIILFTADPWESAMPILRVTGPAIASNVEVIRGNEGNRVYADRIAQSDLVIIQRHFPSLPEYDEIISKARRLKKPVVFEMDDLLFELPEDHISFINYAEYTLPMVQAAMQADAVVTSTPLLQEYLSHFNRNVWFFPNLLNDSIWPKPLGKQTYNNSDGPTVIGYMGGQTHLSDLETITPILRNVVEEYGNQIQLRFWGVRPPDELLCLPHVKWTPLDLLDYKRFADFFSKQSVDIFIAPLRENQFNQCKSPIKFLEYSQMAVPGVYSRMEPYMSIVNNGKNGFLAKDEDAWHDSLVSLFRNPDLRHEMGKNARETVQQEWLLSAHASKWKDVYNQILDSYPSRDSTIKANPVLNAISRSNQFQRYLQQNHQFLMKNNYILRNELITERKNTQTILDSQTWIIARRIQSIREFFVPLNSKREKIIRIAVRFFLPIKHTTKKDEK